MFTLTVLEVGTFSTQFLKCLCFCNKIIMQMQMLWQKFIVKTFYTFAVHLKFSNLICAVWNNKKLKIPFFLILCLGLSSLVTN
jgi:hypothetical protein